MPLSEPTLPRRERDLIYWRLPAAGGLGLRLSQAVRHHAGPVLILTDSVLTAARLEQEIGYFLAGEAEILHFPDWETLPYDAFSPHQDLISRRIETLWRLPSLRRGALVTSITTLLQRIAPRGFVDARALVLTRGQRLDIDRFRHQLETAGYQCVSQVIAHGEFAVRGAIVDLFPMGSPEPVRIDLLDDEIDTLRYFDPETQRSTQGIDAIRLLPAREFPLDEDGIGGFRRRFRQRFDQDPNRCPIYRQVSDGHAPAGIEYYLPLFFEQTGTLFDYLPDDALVIVLPGVQDATAAFLAEAAERHEQRRHDQERPILAPDELFLDDAALAGEWAARRRIIGVALEDTLLPQAVASGVQALPPLATVHSEAPFARLSAFHETFDGRLLLVCESPGRREILREQLSRQGLSPRVVADWADFLESDMPLALTVAPLEHGFLLPEARLAVIAEQDLFAERVARTRRASTRTRDAETLIHNLTELAEGAPVVHEDHGVGRYAGLATLEVGGTLQEFLTLEYAGDARLYVPVSSLHLISRYTGASDESAPLHRLGSDQWEKARRRAQEQVRDVAAELLDIHARRAARKGYAFGAHEEDYARFCAAFPFEETEDQQKAIAAVREDMLAPRPMDRVVCGDVGFGKTEVAMRAAFTAVRDGFQVAVLVPTTLLSEQHLRNFRDRFADWPVRIEGLSRIGGGKKAEAVVADIESGRVDIVIGTHKLIQGNVRFARLGLLIVDEEHRFGVRDKERLKALRAEVDMLTLTATPIPRTLNMALSGIRDLSIIATPPRERLAVKTLVTEWDGALVREAILRELKRGGQVYFLHNEVKTIERTARELMELVPEARARIAHGQMPEAELESTMADFVHQRFNLLVATTIIESGIDVPTANTILINRADKLGLAQLHQLRGRVGRSHHRAWAYLIIPPKGALTADAVKRLEAIEKLEDLGVGFTLATHDLEIRGAGELLGENQSGQIHEIGFTLYMELLERAVNAIKSGNRPELSAPPRHGAEVDLGLPALIPTDYIPDVHTRLILYKRIASASNTAALDALKVEMIDRFGLLPEPTQTLFTVSELRQLASAIGVRKLEFAAYGGRLVFVEKPDIDPARLIALIQREPAVYSLAGADTLRLRADLADPAARIQRAFALLATLQGG
ncbi:MAG: transcription-repair coupling factor [Halothiobacillaceae bacterium]|nr:transcription-repair coupling factor [Halothiobacillaceae bacterium]